MPKELIKMIGNILVITSIIYIFILLWARADIITEYKSTPKFSIEDWKELYEYCAWLRIEENLNFLKK